MGDASPLRYAAAVEDFRRAHRQAALERLLARLRGESAALLSYEEVRRQLRATGGEPRGLREVPLTAIVGSVGRYTDFTRSFLPRNRSDEMRWANVELAMEAGRFPPIELYQIGDAYFVLDGNHRVSIARRLGVETIQAYVTELQSRVPLSPDSKPDDLIIMAELATFLEETELDRSRPEATFYVTEPGRYEQLLEHVRVHAYYMTLEAGREVALPVSAAHWYDEIYQPIVQTIREQGVLRDFPERTATDLYLWLSRHRAALEEALGWAVPHGEAATHLAETQSARPERVLARVGGRLRHHVAQPLLDGGPTPGQWRSERLTARRSDCLFCDVLVPLSGEPVGWQALEQALRVAEHEGARLIGLHIGEPPEEERQRLENAFQQRLAAAGRSGSFVIAAGDVPTQICLRARWADLVVVNVAFPPSAQPVERLRSGLRTLIRRSSRPLLAVPGQPSALSRALLAFDGSPKAQEALFVATYLASAWAIPLAVVAVAGRGDVAATLAQAEQYLAQHDLSATLLAEQGDPTEAILRQAEAQRSDLILVGSYSREPLAEMVLGSTVDGLLRARSHPLLICR